MVALVSGVPSAASVPRTHMSLWSAPSASAGEHGCAGAASVSWGQIHVLFDVLHVVHGCCCDTCGGQAMTSDHHTCIRLIVTIHILLFIVKLMLKCEGRVPMALHRLSSK